MEPTLPWSAVNRQDVVVSVPALYLLEEEPMGVLVHGSPLTGLVLNINSGHFAFFIYGLHVLTGRWRNVPGLYALINLRGVTPRDGNGPALPPLVRLLQESGLVNSRRLHGVADRL